MTNKKIMNYIDALFYDVPKTRKAIELREELIANMNERFEDYMTEGKSENEAYSSTVAGMGDIDDLISEVMPTDDFREEANFYRRRNAMATALAVTLYILGATTFIGIAALTDMAVLGLIILLVFVAIATGILVYTKMSTPVEFKVLSEDEKVNIEFNKNSSVRVLEAIQPIVWGCTVLFYLFLGFVFSLWHPGWIVFPVSAISMEIIKTIINLKNRDDRYV